VRAVTLSHACYFRNTFVTDPLGTVGTYPEALGHGPSTTPPFPSFAGSLRRAACQLGCVNMSIQMIHASKGPTNPLSARTRIQAVVPGAGAVHCNLAQQQEARRAHGADLLPQAHKCDQTRLHPCRAECQCVIPNFFIATCLSSSVLDTISSASSVETSAPQLHLLQQPCTLRIPRGHTHICDGSYDLFNTSHVLQVPSRSTRRTRDYRLDSRATGLLYWA
jgi:hypothetical protein